jgi:hypothetical protein
MMLMTVLVVHRTSCRLAEPLMGGFETHYTTMPLLVFCLFVFLFAFNFASLLNALSRT